MKEKETQSVISPEDAQRQEVRQRLSKEWRIEEQPFRSTVPVIGPLIAAFRTVWNSVAAKWYVRHMFNQQQAYNQLLWQATETLHQDIETLHQDIETLHETIQRQCRLLGDRELSIAALAEQVARLEIRLQKTQGHWAAPEETEPGVSK
jgi:hypothetical protein